LNEQMKAAFGIFAFLMLACKSSISSSSSAWPNSFWIDLNSCYPG
jgi:hypothetical protein